VSDVLSPNDEHLSAEHRRILELEKEREELRKELDKLQHMKNCTFFDLECLPPTISSSPPHSIDSAEHHFNLRLKKRIGEKITRWEGDVYLSLEYGVAHDRNQKFMEVCS
jgi:hypothetical protein